VAPYPTVVGVAVASSVFEIAYNKTFLNADQLFKLRRRDNRKVYNLGRAFSIWNIMNCGGGALQYSVPKWLLLLN
jgi:hypothetical protein